MRICVLHGAFHKGAVGLCLTAEDPRAVNQMAVSCASGSDILVRRSKYEAFPESKVTKVLNMYSIFNLQKRHC
jgi:hypothetical protein